MTSMTRAVLLRCPNCDSVYAVEGQRTDYSKDDLFPIVKNHLCGHALSESKAAIRKYRIIENAVELVIPANELERLPVGEWQHRTATWLPDGALSHLDGSNRPPETPAESASLQSHTGD